MFVIVLVARGAAMIGLDLVDHLLPTWEQMEKTLESFPFQSTAFRK